MNMNGKVMNTYEHEVVGYYDNYDEDKGYDYGCDYDYDEGMNMYANDLGCYYSEAEA